MTFDEFHQSLTAAAPPDGLAPPLQALWSQGKGDWARAHRLVQDESDADAAWVHAHLHRVEGDLGNAGYWYGRAGKARETGPLDEEWAAIAKTLL